MRRDVGEEGRGCSRSWTSTVVHDLGGHVLRVLRSKRTRLQVVRGLWLVFRGKVLVSPFEKRGKISVRMGLLKLLESD